MAGRRGGAGKARVVDVGRDVAALCSIAKLSAFAGDAVSRQRRPANRWGIARPRESGGDECVPGTVCAAECRRAGASVDSVYLR